jgi:hypothetical protein
MNRPNPASNSNSNSYVAVASAAPQNPKKTAAKVVPPKAEVSPRAEVFMAVLFFIFF